MPSKSCICLHTLSTRLKFIRNDGETFSGDRPGSKEGDAGPLGQQEGTGGAWEWPRILRGWGKKGDANGESNFSSFFFCFVFLPVSNTDGHTVICRTK